MERGRLYFTVGLPRSGKSTYCNQWVKEPGPRPRVIVCADDFRQAMHGHDYITLAEPFVWAAVETATRALLARGHDVIMDETSTTENSIRRHLAIDPDAEPIFIDTPACVCRERAKATGRPYLVPIIDRMDIQRIVLLGDDWEWRLAKLRADARAIVLKCNKAA